MTRTRVGGCGLAALAALAAVAPALAAEAPAGADQGTNWYFVFTVITAGFAMAAASAASAFAQGKALTAAMDGIARQPGAAGRIQTALIIGLAFIESLAIYVLLIAFILLFANPFAKFVGGA
jgi:F-type H+-transporting ATPase subunit c